MGTVARLMRQHGLHAAVLVSDPFHMLRLRVLARRGGIQAYSSPTRTSPIRADSPEEWRHVFRESLIAPRSSSWRGSDRRECAAWARICGPGRDGLSYCATLAVEENRECGYRSGAIPAGERTAGGPLGGPPPAGGGGEPLVQRRKPQRAPGPHRLRPPLRAHDVPGLGARAGHRAHRARGAGGRLHERLHLAGPHQLLRDAPGQPTGAGALAGVRPHGLPAPGDDAGEAGQPAQRGAERAPLAGGQPALRRLGRAHPGARLPARPPLPPLGHREHGGPGRRHARRRARRSSAPTTPPTTRC